MNKNVLPFAAAPPVLIGVAIVAVVALLSKDGKKAAPEVDAAPEEPPAPRARRVALR